MHYARFFCNFDELNYEQKTLYLALTDEKGIFHNFIHMRVPNEPTEKDFKAYEMRSPENLNEEFSAFLSDVIQVYETAAKAKESLSPTQMQEQYRRIKAVQMQVGRILFEAGRTNNTVLHEVLARGRGVVPREERAEVERLRGRAQHFDTLQQDYHVVAKDLKALQESIWKEVTDQEIPDPESAKQQISRNYL
jgi:hypothetical protein